MTRKTKIVATIGPASGSLEMLLRLIETGLDVARLNFSHGTHDDHSRVIENIMEARRRTGRAIPILQDLQGPRVRIGSLASPVDLVPGADVTISSRDDAAARGMIPTDYDALGQDLAGGNRILIDDGSMELNVQSTDGRDVRCTVVRGGLLKSHKGMNFPGVRVSAPALTAKDLDDLAFGLSRGVDAVALSFVGVPDDVTNLQEEIARRGGDAWVIAKIERKEAVDSIEEIIEAADGVMVARGDLGVELPGETVPFLQKMIIARCNHNSTPVITATQMLESMIGSQRPTRAELTDVANAVLDGTDLVMLSAETSTGKYPVETVAMMDRIIREAESHGARSNPPVLPPPGMGEDVFMAVAHAACVLAKQVGAKAIVPFTHSGKTAQAICAYRPAASIVAATSSPRTLPKLNLLWGTTGLLVEPAQDSDTTMNMLEQEILRRGLLLPGDIVVLTAGIPLFVKARTNTVRAHRIGEG
ncbi:MAG: pyruvate kinase [Acidobacteria bacterium]|nr:pyruvate kinase [Acidobacteriota bacterium]